MLPTGDIDRPIDLYLSGMLPGRLIAFVGGDIQSVDDRHAAREIACGLHLYVVRTSGCADTWVDCQGRREFLQGLVRLS